MKVWFNDDIVVDIGGEVVVEIEVVAVVDVEILGDKIAEIVVLSTDAALVTAASVVALILWPEVEFGEKMVWLMLGLFAMLTMVAGVDNAVVEVFFDTDWFGFVMACRVELTNCLVIRVTLVLAKVEVMGAVLLIAGDISRP